MDWKLQCDATQGKTRDDVMWAFSHPFSMPSRVGVALGFAYTVLALESICLCCAGWMSVKEGENEHLTYGRGIATACGCCFMVLVVWMLATAVTMQDTNVRTLDNYSIINDCSDEYTHVAVNELTPVINKSTENLKQASFLSYGLFAVYLVACCAVAKQIKDEQ